MFRPLANPRQQPDWTAEDAEDAARYAVYRRVLDAAYARGWPRLLIEADGARFWTPAGERTWNFDAMNWSHAQLEAVLGALR